MKNTIRLLLVVLSLLLVFTLGACDETPDTGEGEGNGETETIDRTDPSAGEYQIRFFLICRGSYLSTIVSIVEKTASMLFETR